MTRWRTSTGSSTSSACSRAQSQTTGTSSRSTGPSKAVTPPSSIEPYTVKRLSAWPTLSLGVGTNLSRSPGSDLAIEARRLHAGLGATGFVHGRRDVQKINFLYHSEAGYMFVEGPVHGHWFRCGTGVGAGTPQLHVRYGVALHAGRGQGGNVGLSHGAVVDIVGGLVAFEVGQQRMRGEPPGLYALATTNLIAVAYLIRTTARRR